MRAAGWLACAAGAGLGVLAACFDPTYPTGPYQCSLQQTCSDPGLSCVAGLCCKEDGGDPACPPPILPDGGPPDGGPPDGGPDAGPDDGGTDAGQDAGCTEPTSPPPCNVNGKDGGCAAGELRCDGGSPYCKQVVLPMSETCDGTDENCDGVVDNYPCRGGPANLLAPSPDYAMGAQVAATNVLSNYGACLHNNAALFLDGGYLNGSNWRGMGPVTSFFYAEKTGGGTWDLSRSGQELNLAFSGVFIRNPNLSAPLAGYTQPIVYLCGPSGYRRYNPKTFQTIQFTGLSFMTNGASIDNLVTGGSSFTAAAGGGLNLAAVNRVEVMMTPGDPGDGGTPAFDAGITTFGFSPP